MRKQGWFFLVLALAAAIVLGELGHTLADPAGNTKTASPPVTAALADYTPWTASAVNGSPEPPSPFSTERVYPQLKLDRPLHLEISSDGKHWLVGQEKGLIYSVPVDAPETTQGHLFLDLNKDGGTDGKPLTLWSLAFHPKFEENGYVYVCFISYEKPANRNIVLRYTVTPKSRAAGKPVCDPSTRTQIVEWPCGVDHFGGCLVFGPDGMLYFSAGDGHGYGDGNETGQRLDDFNASIMRIDVDNPSQGKAYGIPKDNPFINQPNARPEIWAYGLRNVWKFSIDRGPGALNAAQGDLWAGDVGQDLWEPVVLVARGGNYGWSVKEGTHEFRPKRPLGPTPILPPVFEHEHSEARSITGGFVYRGRQFPELVGHYVYGDYETGKVWALKWNGREIVSHRELVDTPFKLVAFGQDKTGELLLLDYQGSLQKLVRNPAAAAPDESHRFPRKLSRTGLFANLKDHTMSPGVVPYDVNSPLWSDGAAKKRFLALPNGGKINYTTKDAWSFPPGTVLVKTFELEMETGNPATLRRLETRLMHLEQGHWRGYTYLWNDEQTEADLLEDPRGRDQVFTIRDAKAEGGTRKQVWHYPSRAECTLCHTMPAGYVLGLTTRQMNRDFEYVGGRDNQLRALERAGLFSEPILPKHNVSKDQTGQLAAYEKLPKMPRPADATADLNQRARAYLDANCSHCHRKWGGGNALFELVYSMPMEETKTVGVPPQHGDFGINDARLLVPGHPDQSLMLWRIQQLGPHRMPRVGSSVIDQAGVQLIEEWIRSMK